MSRETGFNHSMFNYLIDVSTQTPQKGIEDLLHSIFERAKGLVFVDGEKLLEKVNTLTGKRADIINYRFGLGDTGPCQLKEIAEKLGVSSERIRQLENQSVRELRRYLAKESNTVVIYAESYDQGEEMSPELRERREQLLSQIWLSNNIIIPDDGYQSEPDTIPVPKLKEMALELRAIHNKNRAMNKLRTPAQTPIEDLGLSVRAYNVLRRSGIKYIEELGAQPLEGRFRSAGKKTINEIEGKLKALGIELGDQNDNPPTRSHEKPTISAIENSAKPDTGETTPLRQAMKTKIALTEEVIAIRNNTEQAAKLLEQYANEAGISKADAKEN